MCSKWVNHYQFILDESSNILHFLPLCNAKRVLYSLARASMHDQDESHPLSILCSFLLHSSFQWSLMGQSPQPTSYQLSPAFGTLANDSLFPFFRPCEGQGPQVSSRCFPVLVIISIRDGRCSRICLIKIFHHCVQKLKCQKLEGRSTL